MGWKVHRITVNYVTVHFILVYFRNCDDIVNCSRDDEKCYINLAKIQQHSLLDLMRRKLNELNVESMNL